MPLMSNETPSPGDIQSAVELHYGKLVQLTSSEVSGIDGTASLARKHLANLFVRTTRKRNAWNNFQRMEFSKLGDGERVFGDVTKDLADKYSRLTPQEKDTLATGTRKIRTQDSTRHKQMKKAVKTMIRMAQDLERMEADVLMIICDRRIKKKGKSLSDVFATLAAEPFIHAMEEKGLGLKQFKRFCKGRDTRLKISRQYNSNEPSKTSDASTGRNQLRSDLTSALLNMFNRKRPDHALLSRLPRKPWRKYMEEQKLTISTSDGMSLQDLEEATNRKKGATMRLKKALEAVQSGGFFLRSQPNPTPTPDACV